MTNKKFVVKKYGPDVPCLLTREEKTQLEDELRAQYEETGLEESGDFDFNFVFNLRKFYINKVIEHVLDLNNNEINRSSTLYLAEEIYSRLAIPYNISYSTQISAFKDNLDNIIKEERLENKKFSAADISFGHYYSYEQRLLKQLSKSPFNGDISKWTTNSEVIDENIESTHPRNVKQLDFTNVGFDNIKSPLSDSSGVEDSDKSKIEDIAFKEVQESSDSSFIETIKDKIKLFRGEKFKDNNLKMKN